MSDAEQKEVKVIEKVIENKEVAPKDAFGKLTRPQVELIKRTVARGATDDELSMFIQVCKGAQLNPFLRQVHFVKRWDSKANREVGAIQVGIDGFRSIAENSGQYAGNDDPQFGELKTIKYTKNKQEVSVEVPKSATVTVYKLMNGERMPFSATARWDEYYPGPKMGFQWHMRPYLMLGKCAEALALRKAFPKLLSGMHSQEELERLNEESNEDQKVQKGFERLMNLIKKCSVEDLEGYKEKITSSDKYTEEQKHQFIETANKRIEELKAKQSESGESQSKES